MSEKPTIQQYKQNIQDEDFKAYRCTSCGAIVAPPGACYSCGGTEMEWAEVSGKGTLIAFTVIHVAADEFQPEAPYFVAIVELAEGTRVSARLKGFDPLKPEEVPLGIPVILAYEEAKTGRNYLAFKPA
ncbi:hypothetical protein EU538_08285 [Candidatus Thorarchaeota archaeon]|nr:MAG: hypothetical protein EU538_08285 [Candidatus Thorarchaeota archaeon]